MLARQAAIYFAANIFSAVFGFINVVVFTRLFAVEAFGDYLLGLSFSTLFGAFLSSAIKLSILREQSRGDGADTRGVALAAMLLCLLASPAGYGVARLAGLSASVALAALLLSYATMLFDVGQEVLRAEQRARDFLRSVVTRALFVSALGIAVTLVNASGASLLAASSLAFLLAALAFWRCAWRNSRPSFALAPLRALVVGGAPLTLSLSLLALAGATDRFLLANMLGAGAAGEYGASLDLVRQSLIIPAISVASAFVPMAVQLNAAQGADAARAHLAQCLELLLAIVLPACIGFALVSPQIANLVLGPDFRATAHMAMPVLAVSVIFQIGTQQYLHNSFLLSNRNVFYLVNTGAIVLFNGAAVYLLISAFGIEGAVWGRLATDVFGFVNAMALNRVAFALPLAPKRLLRVGAATGVMAAVVALLGDRVGETPATLAILIPAGVLAYAIPAYALNLGEFRGLLHEAVSRTAKWRAGHTPGLGRAEI